MWKGGELTIQAELFVLALYLDCGWAELLKSPTCLLKLLTASALAVQMTTVFNGGRGFSFNVPLFFKIEQDILGGFIRGNFSRVYGDFRI